VEGIESHCEEKGTEIRVRNVSSSLFFADPGSRTTDPDSIASLDILHLFPDLLEFGLERDNDLRHRRALRL